jgi:hypothetical protein
MSDAANGDIRDKRIVSLFTAAERIRYIAMCKAKGEPKFSRHMADQAMEEVREWEAKHKPEAKS